MHPVAALMLARQETYNPNTTGVDASTVRKTLSRTSRLSSDTEHRGSHHRLPTTASVSSHRTAHPGCASRDASWTLQGTRTRQLPALMHRPLASSALMT